MNARMNKQMNERVNGVYWGVRGLATTFLDWSRIAPLFAWALSFKMAVSHFVNVRQKPMNAIEQNSIPKNSLA